MEYSERILGIIAEREFAQYRVAKDNGISLSLFGKWKEKPASKISSGKLCAIADHLGVLLIIWWVGQRIRK